MPKNDLSSVVKLNNKLYRIYIYTHIVINYLLRNYIKKNLIFSILIVLSISNGRVSCKINYKM